MLFRHPPAQTAPSFSHPSNLNPTLVLCPGPPVLILFCLGTGGCQSRFMSSSLELKEVSFMSCYGTRRLCPSGVMRSGPGERGALGAGLSLGGDQQWGSQSGFCAAAVGCVFGNYPPPPAPPTSASPHRKQWPGFSWRGSPTWPADRRVHNTPSTMINSSQWRRDAWLTETLWMLEQGPSPLHSM